MVQTILSDGGIVKEPVKHYQDNQETYDRIRDNLDATRKGYITASPRTRRRLIKDAASYATITANIPLKMADRAFEMYVAHRPDPDKHRLATAFAHNGVGMWDYKSDYVIGIDGSDEIVADVDVHLRSADYVAAQNRLMDLPGLGPAKSAFAPAMLGFTEYACLDTNVAQYFDVDDREVSNMDATDYQAFMSRLFDEVPELDGKVPPFLLQWITFDLQRDGIERHTDWFKHTARIIGSDQP